MNRLVVLLVLAVVLVSGCTGSPAKGPDAAARPSASATDRSATNLPQGATPATPTPATKPTTVHADASIPVSAGSDNPAFTGWVLGYQALHDVPRPANMTAALLEVQCTNSGAPISQLIRIGAFPSPYGSLTPSGPQDLSVPAGFNQSEKLDSRGITTMWLLPQQWPSGNADVMIAASWGHTLTLAAQAECRVYFTTFVGPPPAGFTAVA